ncbi:MAG: 50S ribosomal protein L11 methyltransferase [Nitrospirae bacterium]|nr:MAG: 50S ribosomal protein L11 methyltransferase [Nitrospirota bacterium]
MTKFYLDIQLARSSFDAERLASFFHEAGFLGTWIEEDLVHIYWDPMHWDTRVRTHLEASLASRGLTSSQAGYMVHTVPWEDWNRHWASRVEPVWIRGRMVIRSSWHVVTVPSHAIELILDPKQAFGTGHHATTQLLLEWLVDLIQGGEKVLDLGTGSGILSMAALRLGACSALGIDHDPQAIICAREYARINGFGHNLSFQLGTLHDVSSYAWDLCLANLDTPTIRQAAPLFSSYLADSGVLLVSGILNDDAAEIHAALRQAGWKTIERRVKEGWVALRCMKA